MAKYNLTLIQNMLNEGKVFFAIKDKSIKFVVKHLQVSSEDAEKFIIKTSEILTDADFIESRKLDLGIVADIYKKQVNADLWYIKFGIDDDDPDYVYYVSFHIDKEK